jgi:hypothetical protein
LGNVQDAGPIQEVPEEVIPEQDEQNPNLAQDVSPERELLINYVMQIQRQMLLTEWRVYLSDNPPDENAVASMEFTDTGSAEALLRVSESFWTRTPAMQRETIVHELLHVMTHDLLESIGSMKSSGYVPAGAGLMFEDLIGRTEERLVDRLARVIAEDFALPPAKDPEWRYGKEMGYVE